MSSVRISAILSALLAKGFVLDQRDHKYLFLHVAGKKTAVFTYVSHGLRDADDWLLAQISRQLHLTKKELLRFIECTLSETQYVELLIERGHVRV